MNKLLILTRRSIASILSHPGGVLGGLFMSIFFLIVYHAGIGGVASLTDFGPGGYLAFIFPLSLVSLTMGSASGAGQSLNRDMESGYFRRLALSPAPIWMIAAGALVADGTAALLASGLLIAAGVLLGVPLQFGALSFFGLLGLNLLWSLLLSGLSAGIMLRTRNPQGAQLVTTAVFPLLFLSTTFLPRELILSPWLRVVSRVNPVTYLLETSRFFINGRGSDSPGNALITLILFAVCSLGAMLFAFASARRSLP